MTEQMPTSADAYRVTDTRHFDLGAMPTAIKSPYTDRKDYRTRMHAYRQQLRDLQRQLFAEGHRALLVVIQGVDAAGKNGLIRRVFGGMDPAGIHVWSFGVPNATEMREDFLRRYQLRLPSLGEISVFNRSHYEVALSARVHPEWLRIRGEDPQRASDPEFWTPYYEDIRSFERYLQHNGISVLKLMPHISARAQQKRLLKRLHTPTKRWKLSIADCDDARLWSEFMTAYEACIKATATQDAPWYILPGDDKRSTRLLAADAVVTALEAMHLSWPTPESTETPEMVAAQQRLIDFAASTSST